MSRYYTFDGSGCLWRQIDAHPHGRYVTLDCPDLPDEYGKPTVVTVPRSWLKPAGGVSGSREAPAGMLPGGRTLPAPTARVTDPDTAHLAARNAAGHAESDRELVLRLLAEHGPLTDFDLARLTGRKQTSVGVRRSELMRLGLVERHDRGGVSDTGSPCIRWRLTNAGKAAA